MILLGVIAGVLVLGLVAAAVVLRTGVPGVPDPVTSESFEPLPRGGLQPHQVVEVRFDQAIRGYRMSQVDDVLDRLAEELRDRDAEIARLRAERDGPAEQPEVSGHFEQPEGSGQSEQPVRSEQVTDR